ncbi:MAG: barstar family protein [Polyangiaceae bacterium]
MTAVYELDGSVFGDLSGFASLFSATVLDSPHAWDGNLDAFEDILRGGFGTPAEGFTVRIVNTAAARRALGFPATIAWLEDRARHCHPLNRNNFLVRLGDARAGRGPTLFDMLVTIVRDHGAGGRESEDMIVLELDDGA